MGILNVTPDSFSDGGDHHQVEAAIAAGRQMFADGADILDIGGESTRPGATPVSPAQEQSRILPVVSALAGCGLVSVDTRHAATMEAALNAGASIINDVSALQHDPSAAGVVAHWGCAVILMHMRGTPETMNSFATYADVVGEVVHELSSRVRDAVGQGIRPEQIAVDPGFGFAKQAAHNITLLRSLDALGALGCPVVAGVSRKRFIGELAGAPDPKARGAGSLAAGLAALARGASVLRVHDVADTVQAVRVWQALQS